MCVHPSCAFTENKTEVCLLQMQLVGAVRCACLTFLVGTVNENIFKLKIDECQPLGRQARGVDLDTCVNFEVPVFQHEKRVMKFTRFLPHNSHPRDAA